MSPAATAVALVATAIAVGAVSYALWWRSRPGFGAGRALPPGSLGLVDSFKALRDYDFYRRRFETYGSVFKMSQFHRPVVCVMGLQRIRKALVEQSSVLRPAPLPINRHTTGGLLRFMPPEQHRGVRAQLRTCMSPEVVTSNGPFVAAHTRDVLEEMAAGSGESSSHSEKTLGVALQPHVDNLVFGVCVRIFFGLSPAEKESIALRRIYSTIDHHGVWLRARRMRAGFAELVDVVRAQAERLSDQNRSERSFLSEAIERDLPLLEDRVFAENLAYFLHIARRDMNGLVAWLIKMLTDHPERGLEIRDDSDLAHRFVSETLRLRQSEYLYRQTTAPLQIEKFVIPEGWLVRFCVRESHTDPSKFPDPQSFDPDRFLQRPSPSLYQPFGLGDHSCLGAQMAQFVGRIVVETLVTDYDWWSASDGPMESGWLHHRHWKPHRGFRVGLRARRDL